MSQRPVVVVGSINLDLVVRSDRLPGPGETVLGGKLARFWGGKGANQAVAAARFGAAVSFVGCVGDDDTGRAALDNLTGEGIDTRAVHTAAGEATGTALILVDHDGTNMISVASGANARVSAVALGDVLQRLPEAGVLLTNFEVPQPTVATAVATARAAGWIAIVNTAPTRMLDAGLHGCGVLLTPNEHEVRGLVGGLDTRATLEQVTAEVSARSGGPVVVTLGRRGALVFENGAAMNVATPRVRVRDTTGAGDAFSGVLAAGLAEGWTLAQAATVAAAAASLSTEVSGARGAPHRATLEQRFPNLLKMLQR
ncbi:MAG: ribokinase [Chloroflexota bacterium]